MSIMDIDLTDVADPFDPAPAGRYTVQCTEAEEKPSKSGERMIRFVFQIIEDEDNAGKNIFEYCMLEGKGKSGGLWRMKQICEAAGLDIKGGWDLSEFVSASFDVEISVEPGQGEYGPSNRIKDVYA